jgi:response regulator RpfG family c-di-GMP phosphodiesterase
MLIRLYSFPSPCQRPDFRLLYVGSDQDWLAALRKVLKKPEYHIVSCPDRGTAKTFITSDIQYDLFIFDHEMRDRAAFELIQLVRSVDHRRPSPVMVVGREDESGMSDFTQASGGTAYVRKAKDFSAIQLTISRLVVASNRHPTKE